MAYYKFKEIDNHYDNNISEICSGICKEFMYIRAVLLRIYEKGYHQVW